MVGGVGQRRGAPWAGAGQVFGVPETLGAEAEGWCVVCGLAMSSSTSLRDLVADHALGVVLRDDLVGLSLHP